MNDAPERIWLLPFDGEQRCWCDDPDPGGLGHGDEATEYVRADLYEALQARVAMLKSALIEAERALAIALDDLDEWVGCKGALEKAGFNMDDTADIAEAARAALARIRAITGGSHDD